MLAGGRWNPIGTPMLYTAEHLSLACLEVLVHLDKGQLPRDYVWSKAELPYIPEVLTTAIPSSISACQAAGEAWIRERSKLASRVPSVIIPEEFNVLLNPYHAEYEAVIWSEPALFTSIRDSSRPNPRCYSAFSKSAATPGLLYSCAGPPCYSTAMRTALLRIAVPSSPMSSISRGTSFPETLSGTIEWTSHTPGVAAGRN
jgi:RES domain